MIGDGVGVVRDSRQVVFAERTPVRCSDHPPTGQVPEGEADRGGNDREENAASEHPVDSDNAVRERDIGVSHVWIGDLHEFDHELDRGILGHAIDGR